MLCLVCIPNEDRVTDLCRVRKPDLEILLRINTSSGSFDLEQKFIRKFHGIDSVDRGRRRTGKKKSQQTPRIVTL